ncbi:phosphatase PAP2 family protein [Paramixta manurensis]|uniref:Acid phosphatase n=1 Tax=Paramixta manurensis TaxID=2740817 RepID=A0A6M8UDW3_9GAMM|nr:phosphatase PAP2 family protein [Erwiniaceae bacterium PD-1]
MNVKQKAIMAMVVMTALTACASQAKPQGFLTPQDAPDSLTILPPPPAENTTAFLNDQAVYLQGHTLKNPQREALARSDADYKNITDIFSAAFGQEISPEKTPALYTLLTRVLQDSHDYAMRGAKNHYMRVRPFVVYKDHTCTPEKDKEMKDTGSYPSGHASFGWAAALVLAEINPARQTEILKRGYDFGQSRVVCGAHWQSDVDNGRLMGAAVVASLHNNAEFIRALNGAKQEFQRQTQQTGSRLIQP